uniref:Beta-hexosaminidase n=1 Tax=Arcella intermedia TaxID=1963864 RepID=A0A6B2L2T5_9EUKA
MWPTPASLQQTATIYIIDHISWKFVAPINNSLLLRAFTRYSTLFFPPTTYHKQSHPKPFPTDPVIDTLTVDVQAASESDQILFGTDESYTLQVSDSGASIRSPNVFGALRGLETFSQLITANELFYYINETTIQDSPRFPWRGLLIDTSRHWLPVPMILDIIAGCSYSKINTLHWHVIDGQSFPLESKVYPLLNLEGAYRLDQTYSQEDVAKIVSYANDHGVRVVPEFDMPAHATSWGFGYDFMTVKCYQRANDYDFNDGWGDDPMDPTNPEVYQFIQNFLTEMASLFPDNWFHLGGDEVNQQCWNTTAINQYMKDHNIASYDELETLFIKNVNEFVRAKLNKKLAYWQEVFQHTTPFIGDAVDVWIDSNTLKSVITKGIPAIQSFGWYLDHLGDDWYQFYKQEPIPAGVTPAQAALVLGGEGSMWSETVDNTNFHQKVWTRVSAIAERLWSPKTVTDQEDAVMRLSHHRCRYNVRGIPAEPFQPGPGCY